MTANRWQWRRWLHLQSKRTRTRHSSVRAWSVIPGLSAASWGDQYQTVSCWFRFHVIIRRKCIYFTGMLRMNQCFLTKLDVWPEHMNCILEQALVNSGLQSFNGFINKAIHYWFFFKVTYKVRTDLWIAFADKLFTRPTGFIMTLATKKSKLLAEPCWSKH